MKLATWNVNSLKIRLPHLLDWLATVAPDVVCLQETKVDDASFPVVELRAAGYHAHFSGQKAYNGVAVLTPEPGSDVAMGIGFCDEQKRVVAATIGGLRIVCAYVPNGQSLASHKYQHKLNWLAALNAWINEQLVKYSRLALLGDYNIAPEDRDVYDPRAWEGNVMVSAPEREAFRALQALGLVDSFRLFDQPDGSYTWWDYRLGAFRRNMGLRIDHILLSAELAKACKSATIDKSPRKLDRPSDHTPVIVEISAG
jgi:exodeoxyribonuclease III